MIAEDLLTDLRVRGLSVQAVGENVRCWPKERLTDDHRARIAASKRELIALLRSEADALHEERVAEKALSAISVAVGEQAAALSGCFYCRRVVEAVQAGTALVVGGVEVGAPTALWHLQNCWVARRVVGAQAVATRVPEWEPSTGSARTPLFDEAQARRDAEARHLLEAWRAGRPVQSGLIEPCGLCRVPVRYGERHRCATLPASNRSESGRPSRGPAKEQAGGYRQIGMFES